MTATDTPIHSSRRADIEAWLDQLGATWTFNPDLPLDRIDQAASLANQVRHEPLHGDVVERYTAALHRGDQFPPNIVRDLDGTLITLGGNHRHHARLAANHTTGPAYIVTCDDITALRIRVEDNARHGEPSTTAERVDHAVALMDAGYSQKEAAAIVNIAQPKLSIAAAAIQAGRRARELDISARFHQLHERVRYTLSQLEDDAVFTAAADLALDTGISVKHLADVVRQANATEPAEALRIIGAEYEDQRALAREKAGNIRSSSRTARARFDGALTEIKALSAIDIYDTCPNDDVRAALAQKIMDAARVLHEAHTLLREGPR